MYKKSKNMKKQTMHKMVPVAKREVIEVNKDTINAINLFDEKQLIAAENFLGLRDLPEDHAAGRGRTAG